MMLKKQNPVPATFYLKAYIYAWVNACLTMHRKRVNLTLSE